MKRVLALFAACFCLTVWATAQNLKPDEIVAKHVAAVGSADKLASLKTVMAIGESEFESNVPVAKGHGRAIVVSDPANLFFVMSLNSKEYPFEKVGHFKGKPSLPFSIAGERSLLGTYLSNHASILDEGLFSGVLSLRWPLLDTGKTKPRLTGGGTRKVGDKKFYSIDYVPSGGGSSEFTIRLFFDPDTFDHVRTEYRYEVQPTDATFGQQNRRASAIATLVETFSEFKAVDGLRLPHYHRIEIASNGNSGAYKNSWGIRVAEFRLNQALADDFFTFDAK